MNVSRKIRELRASLRMSQEAFADLLGVSQGTVSKWEKEQQFPGFEALGKMAEIAKVPLKEFALSDQPRVFEPSGISREVPILGTVQYGLLQSSIEWPEKERYFVDLPIDASWERLNISGFEVRDESANWFYPKGSLIFVARCGDFNVEPRSGDRVVHAHEIDEGFYELTVRQFTRSRNGIKLISQSDSKGLDTIEIHSFGNSHILENGGYEQYLGLIGVVIASFVVDNPSRFSTGSPTPIDDE